jgi:hypothetical protein
MLLCASKMVNAALTRRSSAQAAFDRAGNALFHGVKRKGWRACPEAARRLGRDLARLSEISHWVVWPEQDLPEVERARL